MIDDHVAGLIEARYGMLPADQLPNPAPSSIPGKVALLSDVSRRSVYGWIARGIPEYDADKFAVALGSHPVGLWPDWFDAA